MIYTMMHLGGRGRRFLMFLVYVGLTLFTACLIMYMRMVIVQVPAAIPKNASMACLTAQDARIFTERELETEIGRRLPSLPVAYWQKDKHYWKSNETCPPFPSIDDIVFENTYWQTLRTSNGTFYFYGSYMDARQTLISTPIVRILGVHDRINPTLITHCQLWFQDRQKPVIVRIYEYLQIWLKEFDHQNNNMFRPYLMSCKLPNDVRHLVPVSVSVVEKTCDRAINNLRVHYDRPSSVKKNFVICVKQLDYLHEDISLRLVEWIEFVRLMGTEKIFFYNLQVHPNITKVLDYYSAIGVVTVIPFTLPGNQLLNLPGLQHIYIKKGNFREHQMDTIPYNDCLYRNLYKYRWLVLLDINEIIVPVEDYNWESLMQRALKVEADKTKHASYVAHHTYFLDIDQEGWQKDVPSYMYMLKNVFRLRNNTEPKYCTKAFHEVDRVLTLHNHLPLACLGGNCSTYLLGEKHARLHRYHKASGKQICDKCVKRDTLVWRWRNQLVKRASGVLRSLKLVSPLESRIYFPFPWRQTSNSSEISNS